MDKHYLLLGYEIIRFMRENDVKISKLSQESGYTIWELRGACSCGGIGFGEMGNKVRSALRVLTGKEVSRSNLINYPMHCYSVVVKSKGGSKERKYNLFCLEELPYDRTVIYDYAKRIYGGYTGSIVLVFDIYGGNHEDIVYRQ